VPSIVRQPEGEVVLTLGLGWRDLPLGQLLRDRFGTRVLIENDRNLAALGEWSVESGNAIDSLVSLAIAPGAGAGIIINGRLLRGRSNASGELSWFLEDPRLTGRQFARLGDKDHLRFAGISPAIIERLQAAARDYAAGRLTLEALATAQPTGPLGEIRDLIDFATMGVASIASLLNPDLVVLTGGIARGGELVLDAMRAQLRDSLFDPPDLRMTRLGAQDIVLGAIHALLEDHVTSPARGVAVA
jgi:glucokinase